MRFELLFLCAMIAGSASAAAQTGEGPRACLRDGAPSQDYERDGAKEWPQEAQRFKSNEQRVSRQHDRLGPLYLPLHILSQAASALLTRGKPVTVSRVHDLNPLEQTFIAISSSALYAPRPSDDDVAAVLADFGV